MILLKILHRCNGGMRIFWLISVGSISQPLHGRKNFLFHTISIWLHRYCTKKAVLNYAIWCCHLLRNIRTACPTTHKWWYKLSLEFYRIYQEEAQWNTEKCWEYNRRGYENSEQEVIEVTVKWQWQHQYLQIHFCKIIYFAHLSDLVFSVLLALLGCWSVSNNVPHQSLGMVEKLNQEARVLVPETWVSVNWSVSGHQCLYRVLSIHSESNINSLYRNSARVTHQQ